MSIDENPALMNTEPNRAFSEAIRMSECRCECQPTADRDAVDGGDHRYW